MSPNEFAAADGGRVVWTSRLETPGPCDWKPGSALQWIDVRVAARFERRPDGGGGLGALGQRTAIGGTPAGRAKLPARRE